MKPRDYLGFVAALCVAFLIGTCNGSNGTDEWRIRAETAEAALPVVAIQRDSARAQSARAEAALAMSDSAYSADSLAWTEERAELVAQGDSAESDFVRAIDQIRALGDSAVVELANESERQHVATRKADAERIASLTVQLAASEAGKRLAEELADTRAAENLILDQLVEEQGYVIDAWRRAATPSTWERVTGALPEIAVGAGITVGVLILAGVVSF